MRAYSLLRALEEYDFEVLFVDVKLPDGKIIQLGNDFDVDGETMTLKAEGVSK